MKEKWNTWHTDIIGVLFVLFYAGTLPYATMIFSQWGNNALHFCYMLAGAASALFGCAALINIIGDLKEEGFVPYMKNHLLMTAWLIAGAGSFASTGDLKVLLLFVMLAAAGNCDFTKLSRYIYVVHGLFMMFMILSVLHGSIVDMEAARDGIARYSLGYMYPLEAHGQLFTIVLLLVYIKKEKFDLNDLLFVNLSNLILFYLTKARTDALLIAAVTVIAWVLNKSNRGKDWKHVKTWILVVYILAVIWVPIMLCYFGNNDNVTYHAFDRMLGWRLWYMKKGFENFGVSLFGKDISWIGWGVNGGVVSEDVYNFIDNSYLHDMFNFGFFFLAVETVSWVKTAFVLKKRKDAYGLLVVLTFLLCSMAEYHTLNAYTGAQMFFLSYALNEKSDHQSNCIMGRD